MKRKAGRPRTMSEILTPCLTTSSQTSRASSQSTSHYSRRPPISPPTPTAPPQVPLSAPTPNETAPSTTRSHNKRIPEWNSGVKVKISFDSKFQPIGPRSSQLKSQLGQIVRDGQRFPLTFLDWKAIDDGVKEAIWTEVQRNLEDVPDGYKHVCLKCCNTLWKDHKSKTKSAYFEKHKNNPELIQMIPPNIVAAQWLVLVSYWSSEDAKAISARNSSNRDKHGPLHHTGQRNFAQIRYEMEQSGEDTDKMSVWKKTCRESDEEVAQIVEEYNTLLAEKPKDQRNLTIVKDRIFHNLIGEDGHGYCRTYGTTVPRSLVYTRDVVALAPPNTEELVQKITLEITEKLTESFTKQMEERTRQMEEHFRELRERIKFLESIDGTNPHPMPDAISGHDARISIESMGEAIGSPEVHHSAQEASLNDEPA